MAMDAVLRISETEAKAAELIKEAGDKAKAAIQQAETDAVRRQKEIIQNAKAEAAELLAAAVKAAEEECLPIISQGEGEIAAIRNPDPAKLQEAIKSASERIVRFCGNS